MASQDQLETAIEVSSANAERLISTSSDDASVTHSDTTTTAVQKSANILQGPQWILAIAMEPVLGFVLLFNNYQEREWYFFVAHYYTWFLITNTIALWVDPSKRGFWPPFRVIASIQIMMLIGNFVVRNVEDICDPIVIVRFIVLVVYMVHNVYLSYRYGPTIQEALNVLTELTQTKSIAAGWLTMFCLTVLASNLLVNAHYQYGVDALDAPVTSYQATQAFTGSLKAVVLDHCITGLKKKCRVQIIVLLMFVVQWFAVPDLFFKAPLPYLHMLAEFLVFYDVMRVYVIPKSWRDPVSSKVPMETGTANEENEEV